MLKKLIVAAAALTLAAPAFADSFRKGPEHRHFDRGHHHGHHAHRPAVVHHVHYRRPHRHVVVTPPPRVVYYAPSLPVVRPAPVVVHPPVPHGGISIRFNIPL